MKAARSIFAVSIAVLISLSAVSCGGTGSPDSVPVAEPGPGPTRLLPYPADGATAGVNPPGFCWTAHEEASSYRFLLYRENSAEPETRLDDLKSTVAILDGPLAPGSHRWQVLYLNTFGKAFGRSNKRSFTVQPDTP